MKVDVLQGMYFFASLKKYLVYLINFYHREIRYQTALGKSR
ncbi:hypothetical protein VIC_000617 [Vibrio coralliilyticus ATCC BAA-450]|nr:hypothetical protein VIC_000617 [Vibrio coralliilyticus ATCC BAA-450]